MFIKFQYNFYRMHNNGRLKSFCKVIHFLCFGRTHVMPGFWW